MKQLTCIFLISMLPHTILFSQKPKDREAETLFKGKFEPKPGPLSMTDDEFSDPYCAFQDASSSRKDIYGLKFPEEWILDCALDNAPPIVIGIITYLRLRAVMYGYKDVELADSIAIPSYHRFILVGPSGSGKTTLAYAIAKWLGYPVAYLSAASFLGDYRNQTGINISRRLNELTERYHQIVIIIDELHKLFEHHANTHSDDSQTAAAFWLALDEIEKRNPHAIIIGTANNVDKLPAEIKSRFVGKIINIPMPNKEQKIYAFKKMLRKDKNIVLQEACDKLFLQNITDQMSNCSLRDLQLLIDTAKIIYYAENFKDCELEYRDSYCTSDSSFTGTVLLTKKHFQQAIDQLKSESVLTSESLIDSDKFTKRLQNWGAILSMVTSTICLAHWSNYFIFDKAFYWLGINEAHS